MGELKPLVILCVVVAASFSLLGYDIGIMSGAKRLVARDLSLNDVEVEVLVGILNLTLAYGLVSGRVADAVGRGSPSSSLASSASLVLS